MNPLNILVVDDEEGIRDLLYDVLSLNGHNVLRAENGIEALSVISSNPMDVVYLDILMPNGDGLTALRKIRAQWPTISVIIITGCGDRKAVDRTMEIGAFACLAKPFGVKDIIGILEAAESA